MIHLLEPTLELLTEQVAAADDQHRGRGEPGIRHRGNGVGDARSGSDHGHAQLSGEAGVGLGSVGCSLLVTDIDYPDSLADATVKEGDDVTPRKGENGVDPFPLEGPGHQLATVNLH